MCFARVGSSLAEILSSLSSNFLPGTNGLAYFSRRVGDEDKEVYDIEAS